MAIQKLNAMKQFIKLFDDCIDMKALRSALFANDIKISEISEILYY